ncbi:unnamed protein product, partial [Allacma fusca]
SPDGASKIGTLQSSSSETLDMRCREIRVVKPKPVPTGNVVAAQGFSAYPHAYWVVILLT